MVVHRRVSLGFGPMGGFAAGQAQPTCLHRAAVFARYAGLITRNPSRLSSSRCDSGRRGTVGFGRHTSGCAAVTEETGNAANVLLAVRSPHTPHYDLQGQVCASNVGVHRRSKEPRRYRICSGVPTSRWRWTTNWAPRCGTLSPQGARLRVPTHSPATGSARPGCERAVRTLRASVSEAGLLVEVEVLVQLCFAVFLSCLRKVGRRNAPEHRRCPGPAIPNRLSIPFVTFGDFAFLSTTFVRASGHRSAA